MDPLRGLDDLDALNIDPADLASADAVALLEARADLLSAARRPFAAAALRRDVVRRRTTTPALASTGTPFGTIIALIALAQDERDTGDIPAALRAAREAMDMAGSDMALRRVIRAMEANLLDCAGDAAAALAAAPVPVLLARARKARRGATDSSHNAPTREEVNDALTYLQLLRRARAYHSRAKQLDVDAASGGSVDVEPAASAASSPLGVTKTERLLVGAIMAAGAWTTPDQLPRSYLPGLAARPWHDVALHFGGSLRPVAEMLASSAPDLAAEYASLALKPAGETGGGGLYRETECIHAPLRGEWRTYMVNGHWLRQGVDGCSVDTPAACAVMRRAREIGGSRFKLLRAGYSEIGGLGYLAPHCGMTNAQLKMHVGLVVPRDAAGRPCARLRVGNETRAWEQGRVLFFDDSFEHEVWNDCDATRVVYQLVFGHPDVPEGQSPFNAGNH